jgi:hypothetical protein
MKVLMSGAVALLVLALIDAALFNGKYTHAGQSVMAKTASAFLR